MNSLRTLGYAALATLFLGVADFRRSLSPWMLLISHVIPELMRMTPYVLIALTVGGHSAMQYAIPGAVLLATARMTISETSGLPVSDVWSKTLGNNAAGVLPLAGQYLLRTTPLAAAALLDSLVVLAVFGWKLHPAPGVNTLVAWIASSTLSIFAGVAFGLTISVACLGNDLQNLIHNTAASIVTVCSGAVVSLTHIPVIPLLGDILPLTHAITGFRLSLSGQPALGEWILEARNGAGWLIAAAALYSLTLAWARARGQSYLGS